MKILLVNCYTADNQFLKFQKLVYQLFKEESHLVDTEIEFFVRNLTNLDDILYEINSNYTKKEAAKNFDVLDMIFVVGDPIIKPWQPQSRKLLLLMIMCFRTNKIVFCSGIGMLMLVYLAASGFEKYYKVAILGKQNTITQEADLHIDPVTGDLYSVNQEAKSLEIKGNIGLHFRKAAQEFQMMGKFVMQAPVYHPPKIKELQGIYFNSQNELICYIKKTQLHHWAFKDIPMEFKIETNNTWDIHQFSYTSSKRQFSVLADGERGPLIIECNNMLASLFLIDKKYSPSLQIARNFVQRFCELYKSMQISVQSIDKVKFQEGESYFGNKEKEQYLNQFKHSGLAAQQKYLRFTVSNNAIRHGRKQIELKSGNTSMETSRQILNKQKISKQLQESQEQREQQSKEEEEFKALGARQIRLFLHPMISEEAVQNMGEKRQGSYSQRKEKEYNLLQKNMVHTKIKYTPYQSVFVSESQKQQLSRSLQKIREVDATKRIEDAQIKVNKVTFRDQQYRQCHRKL